MNPGQLAQQIRHLLATATWDRGSGGLVFGKQGAVVFAGALSDRDMPPGFPFALIALGSETADEDEPGLVHQQIEVTIAAEAMGDPLGQHAVIGSSRADDGSSAGAGLSEILARTKATLETLTGADGVPIVVSATGLNAPATIGTGRHAVFGSVTLTAVCTSEETWSAPQHARRSGGAMRWHGSECEVRYDFLRYRVGWVDGSTAPISPDEMNTIYTGTASEAVVEWKGQRVYTVFADYDPRGRGYPAASSLPETGSYVQT